MISSRYFRRYPGQGLHRQDRVLVRNRQNCADEFKADQMCKKILEPRHLFSKRFAQWRLAVNGIGAHKVVEGRRRQAIHAGSPFVQPGIYL